MSCVVKCPQIYWKIYQIINKKLFQIRGTSASSIGFWVPLDFSSMVCNLFFNNSLSRVTFVRFSDNLSTYRKMSVRTYKVNFDYFTFCLSWSLLSCNLMVIPSFNTRLACKSEKWAKFFSSLDSARFERLYWTWKARVNPSKVRLTLTKVFRHFFCESKRRETRSRSIKLSFPHSCNFSSKSRILLLKWSISDVWFSIKRRTLKKA